MPPYVLDTDMLVLFQEGHARVRANVLSRSIAEIATTAITAEELLSGWYTLLRRAKDRRKLAIAYQRLVEAVKLLGRFPLLPFDEPAIDRFAGLKALKLGVRHPDLRIAAITLENRATLVTRNRRD